MPKEAFGMLIGKEYRPNELLITGTHFLSKEDEESISFSEDDFTTLEEGLPAGSGCFGWWHSHPGSGLFLSETDISTHISSFQCFNDLSVALIIESTKINTSGHAEFQFYQVAGETGKSPFVYEEIPSYYNISDNQTSTRAEDLIQKISALTGISKVRVKQRIEGKKRELGFFVNDIAAAHIVAKDLNVSLGELKPLEENKKERLSKQIAVMIADDMMYEARIFIDHLLELSGLTSEERQYWIDIRKQMPEIQEGRKLSSLDSLTPIKDLKLETDWEILFKMEPEGGDKKSESFKFLMTSLRDVVTESELSFPKDKFIQVIKIHQMKKEFSLYNGRILNLKFKKTSHYNARQEIHIIMLVFQKIGPITLFFINKFEHLVLEGINSHYNYFGLKTLLDILKLITSPDISEIEELGRINTIYYATNYDNLINFFSS